MKFKWNRRLLWEQLMKNLMLLSFMLIVGSLFAILITVIQKGAPAINIEIITQIPQGGYYLGEGGGILNAIVGSIYLACGGTLIAFLVSIPIVLGLNVYARKTALASAARLALDVMWGTPSIVYGAFGFTCMMALGLRSSLLAGILILGLLELPILVRTMDEYIRMMPFEMMESAFALGATNWEASWAVVVRQALPVFATAILLAFGRGIGDAASVLFTAGYTDRIPESLMDPVASLPLAVFFQLSMPYQAVQQRGYAAALVLTVIILTTSLAARLLSRGLSRHVIK